MLTPGQLDLLKLQLYLHRGGDLGLAQGRLDQMPLLQIEIEFQVNIQIHHNHLA